MTKIKRWALTPGSSVEQTCAGATFVTYEDHRAEIERITKLAEAMAEALEDSRGPVIAWAMHYVRSVMGGELCSKESWHDTHRKIVDDTDAALNAWRERD